MVLFEFRADIDRLLDLCIDDHRPDGRATAPNANGTTNP
jgi:hypothetical protein